MVLQVLLNHPENVECKSLLSDSTRLQWNNVLTLTETIHNEVSILSSRDSQIVKFTIHLNETLKRFVNV